MNKKATITVTVTVAGRNYPLTVEKDKEDQVRRTAESLNQAMKTYKEKLNLRVGDKQDLLFFVAFDNLFQKTQKEELYQDENHKILHKLKSINNTISSIS